MTAAPADLPSSADTLARIDQRLRWLAVWTIHNANHFRPSLDGVKVGGHQASCASMSTIMAALYFHALRPQDRVAVKPHAGPLLHAVHYLTGNTPLIGMGQPGLVYCDAICDAAAELFL